MLLGEKREDRIGMIHRGRQTAMDKSSRTTEYTFDKVSNITTRTDTNHYAAVEHRYSYDGLYQLTEASGDYTNYPYGPNAVTGSNWKRSCKQTLRVRCIL